MVLSAYLLLAGSMISLLGVCRHIGSLAICKPVEFTFWALVNFMTSSKPRTSTPLLHPHVAAKVRELTSDLDTRILDLGCGSGALLERLAGMGYRELTGIDILPPASTKVIRYKQADLDWFRLHAADGSFDFVLAVEVI